MKKLSRFLVPLLAAALLLSSCGLTPPAAKATTMYLKRTEGRINVSDDAGKDVEPREDLGLYSGYGVETKRKSYAWIDLDEVKLTKLDEESEIEITKDGKELEIEVKAGSLFFNVTEPLEDGETMTIRASTMAVGIRGTCGWVTLEDDEHLTLYLLEGDVECTARKNSASVTAGQVARMSEDGEIEVVPFAEDDIPVFVLDELDEDFLDETRDLFAPPAVLASEPPLMGSALDQPVPDFLNEEQKQLFLHALCAVDEIFGAYPGDMDYFPLADGSEPVIGQIEFAKLDGQTYRISQGRYRQWDDFQAMMDGLFTPEYGQALIGTGGEYPPRFRSTENGLTCFLDTARGDDMDYIGSQIPDVYELVSRSEDELAFNLIGHYADLLDYDSETGEYIRGEPYTESYPVRMVRTDQGWRVAEISTPW